MPLRIKKGQHPKYRLIHATNHKDGCLLMVDNICNRWQALQEIQTGGQLKMWEENCNNQILDENDIEKKVIKYFSQFTNLISLNEALAKFFVKHGPICSTSTVRKIIRKIENENYVEIIRNPATTDKGKPSTFMNEGKGKTISLRWLQ